jgi:hypothetical protein
MASLPPNANFLSRRAFHRTAAGLIAASFSGLADAQGSKAGTVLVTPEVTAAVERALKWLAGRQLPDGAFGTVGTYKKNVGIAGLAGLAFLSAGSQPGRGPFGENVDRVLDYLQSRTSPSGYIVEDGVSYHGPMYGHGFAAMFLAEAYGTTERPALRGQLRRAIDLIIDSQNDQGGWRYTPASNEADISVTACQLMALRAARNTGLAVPKKTIDRGIDYVTRCQNADGGFRYRLFEAAESKFPRSAAAVVSLYTSGIHDGAVMESGRRYLQNFFPGVAIIRDQENYFYGHYYATQAAWHAGGRMWEQWYSGIRDELLRSQLSDGGWSDPWFGNEYSTAMALIILQVPNHLLPIFDR